MGLEPAGTNVSVTRVGVRVRVRVLSGRRRNVAMAAAIRAVAVNTALTERTEVSAVECDPLQPVISEKRPVVVEAMLHRATSESTCGAGKKQSCDADDSTAIERSGRVEL